MTVTSSPPRLLAPILFGALLIASIVVAGVVLSARSPNLALEVRYLSRQFSPNGDGHNDTAHIRFFVRESDPGAQVEIVRNSKVVRTLARARALVADRPVRFTWDGRTNSGEVARPGGYRLRVVLPSQGRDMVYPRLIELHLPGGPAPPPIPGKTPRDTRAK